MLDLPSHGVSTNTRPPKAMQYIKRKGRNISVRTVLEVDGQEHFVELSLGTKDADEARLRTPAKIDEAYRRIRKKTTDPGSVARVEPELKSYYLECPLFKANHQSRCRNWDALILLLDDLGLDKSMAVNYLAVLTAGKSIIRQHEEKFGDVNRLRKVRSIFNKNFLHYLEVEKDIDREVFSHLVAYTPAPAKVKPFMVSDDTIEQIYKKGMACRETHPEYFKAFLLASSAGLRRSEILRLTWGCLFKFEDRAYIVLEQTKAGYEQRVNIPLSTYEALTSMNTGHQGPHEKVIGGPNPTKLLDRGFIKFLREEIGIVSDKPMHYLRKCLGAMLASKHGIYVASKTLRHASVTTTEKYYADLVAPANDIEVCNYG